MGFVHIRTSANLLMVRMNYVRITVIIIFIKQNNAWFFLKRVAAILEKDATSFTKQEKAHQ